MAIILAVWTLHRHEPPSKGFAFLFSLMVLSGAVLLAWYTVYSNFLAWGPSAGLILTLTVEVLGFFLILSGFLSSKPSYSPSDRHR
jgi:hypothetical protein